MSEPITRLNAALSGRYTIERELGEGELFFVSDPNDLMVAGIEAAPRLRVAGRQRLFTIPVDSFGIPNPRSTNYDVAPDGKRFLMARAATDTVDAGPPWGVIVAQNWVEELRELLGG